jgi:hypothetical protein
MNRHCLVTDGFSPAAVKLRAEFDRRFRERAGEGAAPGRFVWDFWHVPDQYTLLRTPAYHFFSAKLYESWHRRIVEWGRATLGCHDISPPWLSCYVDGCEQQMHADHPHGPWAFVYSLTDWRGRDFSGGETQILKPKFLREWAGGGRAHTELRDIFDLWPPRFNRLLVFDPRLPHGVRRVQGAGGVLGGRLVMHGWFVQPRPFFTGALKVRQVEATLTSVLGELGQSVRELDVHGYISLRLNVGRDGHVRRCLWLTNTLVGDHAAPRLAVREIERHFRKASFARSSGATVLTVPVRLGH